MDQKTFLMFSASGLSELNEGERVPDFSKAYPDYFRNEYQPEVIKKYEVSAKGLSLYQGKHFVHNVREVSLDKIAKGAVMTLGGSKEKMEEWMGYLDDFENSYGMEKETWTFKILENEKSIDATIYYLKDRKNRGNKDGRLLKVGGLSNYFFHKLFKGIFDP